MLLDNRVVLVTGAAGALGGAIAQAVRAHGGTVFATDLRETDGIDARHDVSSEADWQRVVQMVEKKHGRLDGLVNNAGIVHIGTIESTSFAEWRKVLSVNADGVFLGCQTAWPLLRRSAAPSIVNISSVSGIVGSAAFVAYNASKGAVRLMTKSIALHGAQFTPPVRCNSVHPCLVEGPMSDGLTAFGGGDPAVMRERFIANIPMGRFARPAEIGNAVVYLLSDLSTIVTGSELVTDGGYTAR